MGLIAHFNAALAALQPGARLYVAYSGGLDSACLLHLTADWAAGHGQQVTALHLNHGISCHADSWQSTCATQCDRLGVEFVAQQAQFNQETVANLEQRARDVRYAWFESLLEANDILLTAHHREDQAETLLLRMLRGSGTRGMSGIPVVRPLGKGRLLRPLLKVSRNELLTYAEERALEWVEDESNDSLDFDRNYIRHEILPRLRLRWPQTEQQFARVASHLLEDRALLDELAEEDMQFMCRPEFSSFLDLLAPLDLDSFRHLSRNRQRNLLQYLVPKVTIHPLPMERQREWLRQVAQITKNSRARLVHNELVLAVHQGSMHFLAADREQADLGGQIEWRTDQPLELTALGVVLRLRQNGAKCGPERVLFEPGDSLQVHWRRGGERVTLPGEDFSRSLKKLLQARGVAPWLRRLMPLVSCRGQLIWSAALGDFSPSLADTEGNCYTVELVAAKRLN